MNAQQPPGKICALCGEDCSGRPRTRDARGRYYCATCYERARRARPQTMRRMSGSESLSAAPAGTAVLAEAMTPPAVDTPRCKGCGHPLPDGAVLCVHCGLDLVSGKRHRSRVRRAGTVESASMGLSRWDDILAADSRAAVRAAWWDFIKPACIVLIGLCIVIAWMSGAAESAEAPSAIGTLVAGYLLRLAVQVAVGVAGLWILAHTWLGGAGPLHLAVVRLAAIYIVVDVIWIALSGFLLAAFVVGVFTYLGLLMWFFELEPAESLLLALITFFLKLAVIALLITVL
jgi:hypothetical protein